MAHIGATAFLYHRRDAEGVTALLLPSNGNSGAEEGLAAAGVKTSEPGQLYLPRRSSMQLQTCGIASARVKRGQSTGAGRSPAGSRDEIPCGAPPRLQSLCQLHGALRGSAVGLDDFETCAAFLAQAGNFAVDKIAF